MIFLCLFIIAELHRALVPHTPSRPALALKTVGIICEENQFSRDWSADHQSRPLGPEDKINV